ncbi:MAG TPA: caspase family protein, partial [Chitinivibrionales bacterium]
IAKAPEADVCAAALGDGTIRWYRLFDGQELLALAISRDLQRWAAWTPSGLWDASNHGGDLIVKCVNNDQWHAADVNPVSRTGQDGYAPRAIKHLFESSDFSLKNKPAVFILQPSDASTVHDSIVALRLTITTPREAPILKVDLIVNGNLQIAAARGLAIAANKEVIKKEYPVALSLGANTLSIVAYNQWGCSDTAKAVVSRQGLPLRKRTCNAAQDLFVFSIGISRYNGAVQPLTFPAKDAEDFAKIWSDQTPCPYRRVLPTVLTDEQATKRAILDDLYRLCAQASARDMIMIFMAGHAIYDAQGHFCFLPSDVSSGDDCASLINDNELFGPLKKSPARILCFFDACNAGNSTFGYSKTEMHGGNKAHGEIIIFHSTAPFQAASENDTWNSGVFTKALFEGLRGSADYSATGIITVTMLGLYISERVNELTQGLQTPVMTLPGAFKDFPLALVRGKVH